VSFGAAKPRIFTPMSLGRTPLGRNTRALWWAYWPRLDYSAGLALQHRLHAARGRGEIPDVLVVTEHLPTVTLGRRGSLADLPLGARELAARGIGLYKVGRGGRATFHGPGQLVLYPIVDLRALRIGPRRFVEAIEQATIHVLRAIGVKAERGKAVPGVWVGTHKIAAVGLEILDGVTRHGLSLNLRREITPPDLIIPCGMPDVRPTSVDALANSPPSPIEVGSALARELAAMLDLSPCQVETAALLRETRRPSAAKVVPLGSPG